jgi:cation diffusion facilitator family transporter
VLTDVWTSAGVVAGLAAVWVTGWVPLDPIIALGVAANIVFAGWRLMRDSIHGLMDAADETELARLVAALESAREDSWIDVHDLRAWRSGAAPHADLHMTVPRYFDVEALHAIHDRVDAALRGPGGTAGADRGDVVVHFDPCRPEHCPRCPVPECPVRAAPFRGRDPFDTDRTLAPAGPASGTRNAFETAV